MTAPLAVRLLEPVQKTSARADATVSETLHRDRMYTGLESPGMIHWAGFIGTTRSVMRNPIDIDHTHSRAICREIGERLQQHLRIEAELPANIRKQIYRLHELEGKSPSIVANMEHGFGNEPRKGVSRKDASRFTW